MTPASDAADETSSFAAQRELQRQYQRRFEGQAAYRDGVWRVLTADFFARFIAPDATVLDLGCGYAQFINNIQAGAKYAMDLNPSARDCVREGVTLIEQDCSERWPLDDGSLDVVFTSNFLEHLPSKVLIRRTLGEARRCLKANGRIICLGPNVRYVPGAYWDFWDHHVPLSDRTVAEVLELSGFRVERRIAQFLPFTMAEGPAVPLAFVKAYVHLPIVWPLFGRQFLVVARAA